MLIHLQYVCVEAQATLDHDLQALSPFSPEAHQFYWEPTIYVIYTLYDQINREKKVKKSPQRTLE